MNRILTVSLLLCAQSISVVPVKAIEVESVGARHSVAVENACAWPSLTLMRDGTVVAILHNKPAHGTMEADVECWASSDGLKWEKRSTVTQHEAQTIRMNHAAGLANNGDLIVLCSGWTDVKQPERPKQALFRDAVLRPWVLRSRRGRNGSGFGK